MILRPRQVEFVEKCNNALNKFGNTLGVANTGFGKTVAFSAIIDKNLVSGKAAVVAHRDELTGQNSRAFQAICPDVSISFYTAQKKSWDGRVTFSMAQTLSRDEHLEVMPPLELLVFDEAHHVAADSYQKIVERAKELNPSVRILGVTATPERADNKGLLDTFDNVGDFVTIGEMVRAGFLVPPKAMVIDIGTQKELSALKKTAGDYNQVEVEAIQNTYIHNREIINNWQKHAYGRPTVAFCATIQHSIDIRDAFRRAGIKAEAIHSKVSMGERRAILKAFDDGNIDILANPMLLTEGWDSQVCSCIMLLRASSFKSTVIQMVGRGLRKIDPLRHPGILKHDCIVLDFGISLINHGDLESDVRLKPTKDPEDDKPMTKDCPECESVIPLGVMECPLCGYVFQHEEEDGTYNEEEEIKLIELDLINNSPFKWTSLFVTDRVHIASGFDAWAGVFSKDEIDWYAIGSHEKKVRLLTVANRIGAFGSANDFMRLHETNRSAKKASRWMKEPASEKQVKILNKYGSIKRKNITAFVSKIEAAAHITFRFNRKSIERIILSTGVKQNAAVRN